MPKVEKIGANTYRYQCVCGCMITLETDRKPERLTKCWECLNQSGEVMRYDSRAVRAVRKTGEC